jgi:hypothetical protein
VRIVVAPATEIDIGMQRRAVLALSWRSDVAVSGGDVDAPRRSRMRSRHPMATRSDRGIGTLGMVMLYASGVGTSPLDHPDGVGVKVSAGRRR